MKVLHRFKSSLKKVIRSNPVVFKRGVNPDSLTDTQNSFLVWNAQRLGISLEESKERYFLSWRSIVGGHAGPAYRMYADLSYSFFNVFYNDNGDEVYTAYERHSYMHFLRMLSYPEPQWKDDNFIIQHLGQYSSIDILDYGCGLAQSSRSLATYLNSKGKTVRLFLVDIPTIRKEFLLWLGGQLGIETVFLSCTIDSPIPKLPNCDVCIATEFFEHVFEPLRYFNEMHTVLRNEGLFITNIADHHKEFMHVSPNLQVLRTRIKELNYDVLKENQLLRKRL